MTSTSAPSEQSACSTILLNPTDELIAEIPGGFLACDLSAAGFQMETHGENFEAAIASAEIHSEHKIVAILQFMQGRFRKS